MQFASFDLCDPIFDLFGIRLSVQVVTLENLYGLDPERTTVDAYESPVDRGEEVLPTIAFQDGTLEQCRDAIERRLRALAATT